MLFTDAHLKYWVEQRPILKESHLLPGFVRFERWRNDAYVVDQPSPVQLRDRQVTVTLEDRSPRHYANLDNPYQGFYVLDRELAEEQLRYSPSRSPLLSRVRRWDLRERAATGPIFDDVPAGLLSRNVVPIRLHDQRPTLDPICLIDHLGVNYANNPDSKFGNLLVEDIFKQ